MSTPLVVTFSLTEPLAAAPARPAPATRPAAARASGRWRSRVRQPRRTAPRRPRPGKGDGAAAPLAQQRERAARAARASAAQQPRRILEAEALEQAHATVCPSSAGAGRSRASSASISWRAIARCRSRLLGGAAPRANFTWSAASARSRVATGEVVAAARGRAGTPPSPSTSSRGWAPPAAARGSASRSRPARCRRRGIRRAASRPEAARRSSASRASSSGGPSGTAGAAGAGRGGAGAASQATAARDQQHDRGQREPEGQARPRAAAARGCPRAAAARDPWAATETMRSLTGAVATSPSVPSGSRYCTVTAGTSTSPSANAAARVAVRAGRQRFAGSLPEARAASAARRRRCRPRAGNVQHGARAARRLHLDGEGLAHAHLGPSTA